MSRLPIARVGGIDPAAKQAMGIASLDVMQRKDCVKFRIDYADEYSGGRGDLPIRVGGVVGLFATLKEHDDTFIEESVFRYNMKVNTPFQRLLGALHFAIPNTQFIHAQTVKAFFCPEMKNNDRKKINVHRALKKYLTRDSMKCYDELMSEDQDNALDAIAVAICGWYKFGVPRETKT